MDLNSVKILVLKIHINMLAIEKQVRMISNWRLFIYVTMELTDTLITPKPTALSFMLQTCWNLFFPYLSNLEIGRLDSALTDRSLRILYLDQVNDFYLVNKIYSEEEFEWILLRNIALTKCHLGFDIDIDLEGNIVHLTVQLNMCIILVLGD